MNIEEAVKERIIELCRERDISINKLCNMSGVTQSTVNKYRFAMEYMLLDTADADNVGIRSLYIIRLADDTDPQFAYRGDEKYTPGININKKSRIPH